MKKVLLVTTDFPPSFGGVANYYHNLCNHLEKDSVFVLANKQLGSESFDKDQSYKIFRENLFLKRFWPKWLPMIWKILKAKNKSNADLIGVGQVLPVGVAVLILNFFVEAPFFVLTHGMDIMLGQRNKWKKNLLKKVLFKAEFVTANSLYTKSKLLELGIPESKIIVVYPGVEIQKNISDKEILNFKKELGVEDKKIILTLGRLVERKGASKMIEAMPQILKEVPEAVYLIVGKGEYKHYLLEKVRKVAERSGIKNFQSSVRFLEAPSQKHQQLFYGICDIFSMPCIDINGDVEGFGIVYLEAAVFNKPSIAGDSGGAKEAVLHKETGFVVSGHETTLLANHSIELLKNEGLRVAIGKQGNIRAEKEFRWNKTVWSLKEILSK